MKKTVKRSARTDRWGFPRVAYVYPSRRAAGYNARAVDENGNRTRNRFFGHKRWGSAQAAYDAARAFVDASPARRRTTLHISTQTKAHTESTTPSDHRYRLGLRQFDLRPAGAGGADWHVTVRATHGPKQVRRYSVERYGLVLALRNAAMRHVTWFERETGRTESVGAESYVRLMRYVLDQHGLTPIHLWDLEVPARVTPQRGVIRVQRDDGRERRFGYRDHGGRFPATIAGLAWAVEPLRLITALPAALTGETAIPNPARTSRESDAERLIMP